MRGCCALCFRSFRILGCCTLELRVCYCVLAEFQIVVVALPGGRSLCCCTLGGADVVGVRVRSFKISGLRVWCFRLVECCIVWDRALLGRVLRGLPNVCVRSGCRVVDVCALGVAGSWCVASPWGSNVIGACTVWVSSCCVQLCVSGCRGVWRVHVPGVVDACALGSHCLIACVEFQLVDGIQWPHTREALRS